MKEHVVSGGVGAPITIGEMEMCSLRSFYNGIVIQNKFVIVLVFDS